MIQFRSKVRCVAPTSAGVCLLLCWSCQKWCPKQREVEWPGTLKINQLNQQFTAAYREPSVHLYRLHSAIASLEKQKDKNVDGPATWHPQKFQSNNRILSKYQIYLREIW